MFSLIYGGKLDLNFPVCYYNNMEIYRTTAAHNPIAEAAIMALNANPELLPSFKEEMADYLFGKMLLESETGELATEEEVMEILRNED